MELVYILLEKLKARFSGVFLGFWLGGSNSVVSVVVCKLAREPVRGRQGGGSWGSCEGEPEHHFHIIGESFWNPNPHIESKSDVGRILPDFCSCVFLPCVCVCVCVCVCGVCVCVCVWGGLGFLAHMRGVYRNFVFDQGSVEEGFQMVVRVFLEMRPQLYLFARHQIRS